MAPPSRPGIPPPPSEPPLGQDARSDLEYAAFAGDTAAPSGCVTSGRCAYMRFCR